MQHLKRIAPGIAALALLAALATPTVQIIGQTQAELAALTFTASPKLPRFVAEQEK